MTAFFTLLKRIRRHNKQKVVFGSCEIDMSSFVRCQSNNDNKDDDNYIVTER